MTQLTSRVEVLEHALHEATRELEKLSTQELALSELTQDVQRLSTHQQTLIGLPTAHANLERAVHLLTLWRAEVAMKEVANPPVTRQELGDGLATVSKEAREAQQVLVEKVMAILADLQTWLGERATRRRAVEVSRIMPVVQHSAVLPATTTAIAAATIGILASDVAP